MFILRRDAQVAVAATAQALGLSSEMIAIFDKNLVMLQAFQTKAVVLNTASDAESKSPIFPADSVAGSQVEGKVLNTDSVAESTTSDCTRSSHSIGDENMANSPDVDHSQRIGAATGLEPPLNKIPGCEPECFFLDSDAENYAMLKDISDKFDSRLAKLEEDCLNNIMDMNEQLANNERCIGEALMDSAKDTLESSREIAREYQSLVVSKLSEMGDSFSKKCSMVTDLAKQMEALLALYAKKLNDYEGDTYYDDGPQDLRHPMTKSQLATSDRPVAALQHSTPSGESGIGKNKSSRIDNNKSSSGIGHERGSMFAKT